MTLSVENLVKNEEKPSKPGSCYGVRHTQFILLSSAAIIAYGVRSILSVAVVAMTSRNPPNKNIPTYPEWDNKNIMQSAFFWGYVIPQIGAGQLAKNFGPKRFFAAAMFISSVSTLVVPFVAASLGSYGVMGCRMVTGLSQGFFFPSMHNLLGKWTPLEERSRVATFVYVGGPLGTMLAMPITGFISDSSVGWPTSFYVYGAVGLIWFGIFIFIGCDSPDEHTSISMEEKRYIKGKTEEENSTPQNVQTPWRAIATSLPFIAILVAHCGQNWSFWTLMNAIPSYMSGIMEFELEENGLLSALPYFVLCILSAVFSPISDLIIKNNICTIGTTRKIFNSIGKFLPAISLIALAFVDAEQKNLAITLLVASVGINAAIYCGYNVNHIDLAPVHAGTLMGITNSLSNTFSIAAPLFMQAIIDNHEDEMFRWRIIFWVSAGFLVAGGTFFAIFASGEIQPWNNIQPECNKDFISPSEKTAESKEKAIV